jgi:hypothetical protein
MVNYAQICFVIMPFGKKPVGGRDVDFDCIYDTVFVPAINAVGLPEGGKLDPRRTDKDFFSGDINMEMFSYLEYSRFAVADITGLNANVFYELGARHRTRDSGTAIFRQANAPIPFDIQTIKAFPYEYRPVRVRSPTRQRQENRMENSAAAPPTSNWRASHPRGRVLYRGH